MKKSLLLTIAFLLAADLAFASRIRPRTTENNAPKTGEQQVRAQRVSQDKEARSSTPQEVQMRLLLSNAAMNSRGVLREVDGLVNFAKNHPTHDLVKLAETANNGILELSSSTRDIDLLRSKVHEQVLEVLQSFAEVSNGAPASAKLKEEQALMLDFINNYVFNALSTGSNWNSVSTSNLLSFVSSYAVGVKRGLSLENVIASHGKFTYKEFRERCRA